jgi:hypothetical protein
MALSINACDNSPAAPESGYIEASVSTTGGDPDVVFEIVSDSVRKQIFSAETAVFKVATGTHSLELRDVADNCLVDGNAARSVDVASGDTARVIFGVACAETGIRVVVRMTGTDPPVTFDVEVSPQLHLAISPNGTGAASRLAPGRYQVRITAAAPNCSIDGDSVVPVDVVNRQMTEIVFSVQCIPQPRRGTIAFVENATLMLMNEDGSGVGELNRGWHPSWSRDQTRLVYSTTECDDYSCTGSLEIVDPVTRQVSSLPNAGSAWTPAWSPVDDVIAFFKPESVAVFLYNIPTATTSKISVEGPAYVLDHPSWSPDGLQLVGACAENDGQAHLCLFNRDGTGFRYLTFNVSFRDQEPSWSPDGTSIVFTRYSGNFGRITVINVDGSGLRTVTEGTSAAWSPDSRRIIFTGLHQGLFTINTDGTGINQLTDGADYAAAWRH